MYHLVLLIFSIDPTITDLLHWITQGGVVGLLTFVIIGGAKKWWVFGWQYKETQDRIAKIEQERDDWRDLALMGTNLTQRTVDLFKKGK